MPFIGRTKLDTWSSMDKGLATSYIMIIMVEIIRKTYHLPFIHNRISNAWS